MSPAPRPPRIAEKLVESFAPAWQREGLLGDLEEGFAARAAGGPLGARLWYWRQVAALLLARRAPARGVEPASSARWSDLSGDMRYAIRGCLRAPMFSLTVITTLALGLGLAAAIFSFADGYLFRSLPFPGGDRAYYVRDPQSAIASMLKASDLVALRQSPVAELGFVEWSVGAMDDLVIGDRHVAAFGYQVSEGFRRTLALPLIAGRDFTHEDHAAGAPRVAWMTYRFWQREFRGDRDVIGHTFVMQSVRGPHELRIVGILGPEVSTFDLNNQPPDLVVPESGPVRVGPNSLAMPLVLLPEGVSVEVATARIAAALEAAAPGADGRPRTIKLTSLVQAQLAGGRPTARVFFAGAMLVLLLAAMNLVHLLLSRMAARVSEVATKVALGASRWRVVRASLAESLLLGSGGIAGGLLLGKGLSVAISARVPAMPINGRNLSMVPMLYDARVVVFASALGLLVAVAGGIWPAWRASRRALGPPRTGGGVARAVSHRLARWIVASELTVATVVIVGAVFVGLGIYRYLHQPLGFDYVDRFRVFVSAADRKGLAAGDLADALHAIRGVGGVSAAGFEASTVNPRDVDVPGQSIDPKKVWIWGAGPGHFESWGLMLDRGRWFEADEFRAGEAVAVVDARLAAMAWPGADPIGATVRAGGLSRRVVGVVRSRRYTLERDPDPSVYVPMDESTGRGAIIAWAPSANVADIRARLSAAVTAAVPGAHVEVIETTFDGFFARGLGEARFQTPVIAAFGVLAALLAGVGLFGLVSYLVEQRRREFGIRLAIGARPVDVWRTVIRESIGPTLVGLLAGCAGAWALETVVRSSVFGWQSSGPLAMALVAAGLLAVALVAALAPAGRAARIDPAITLRAD